MRTSNRSPYELTIAPRILDQYVAREFMIGYFIALSSVLLLRVLIELFLQLDELSEEQSGVFSVLSNILNYFGPKLFEYFRDFSGMMVLLAAVFSLMRMTRQNELTAVLASGVSLKRIITPIVILGFCLNLLMVIDQELILPQLADKLLRKPDEMSKLKIKRVPPLPDIGESLLTANKYDPQTQTMFNMLVILREKSQMTGRITAEKAVWNHRLSVWELENGREYGSDLDSQSQKITRGYKNIAQYKSELSADNLWLFLNSHSKSLMSSADLSALLRKRLKPGDRADAIGEKHFRFTDPIINMVMLLVGLPLLISRERRSTKTSIFLAMIGAGGCFILTFACKLLAGGSVDPIFAAWLPIIIFLPLSVLALDSIKT